MKLDTTTYREAAELLFEQSEQGITEYCCTAIAEITWKRNQVGYGRSEEGKLFEQYFMPYDKAFSSCAWFGDPTPENQATRITALLFMEQIAKDSK